MPESHLNEVSIGSYPSGQDGSDLTFRPARYKTRDRSWVRTPNFRTLPRRELPNQPYSDKQVVGYQNPGTRRGVTSNPSYNVLSVFGYQEADLKSSVNSLVSAGLSELTPFATLQNEVLIQALNQAADVKVNIPVAIAEGKKTATMITTTASRVFNAYKSFRKGRLREVAGYLGISPKVSHKTWLEYRYGWMPLLMDVKGSAELFAQHHFPRPKVFRVSKTVTVKTVKRVHLGNQYGFQGSYRTDYNSLATVERRVNLKLWMTIENSHLSKVQQMGLTNPALVAWELVPFSFVFDWFIQVGDWLTAITALQGLSIQKCQSSLEESGDVFESWSDPYIADWPVSYMPFGVSLGGKSRFYQRVPLNVDQTLIYPPRNRDPFNWKRMISGLSLMKAQSSRFR